MATETTLITYIEGAAASTPAATRVVTYSKADGLMYSKDDAGVETLMSGGSGSVATDAIWDAVGDTVVGSGANTAVKRKNNDGAAVAPTVNEDSGDGYAIGSRWLDTTADKEYVALDVTVGAAVWTETTSTGSGAPTTAKYLVAAADGGLSAEIPRPELDDYSISGATAIDFTNPTSEASVTDSAETDMACKVVFANIGARAHSYVSEALGTGDFDVRMRIAAAQITTPHTAASSTFHALFVADSSLTAATRQSLQVNLSPAVTSSVPSILAVTNVSGIGQTLFYPRVPIILRIARSGTTVTFYYSENEGRTWTTLATATASTDFQRVGILGQGGSTGTQSLSVLVHWLRKF